MKEFLAKHGKRCAHVLMTTLILALALIGSIIIIIDINPIRFAYPSSFIR